MKSTHSIIKTKFWILKVLLDISQHDFQCALIVSTVSEEIYSQFQELLQDTGIFKFMLKIKQDFSHEAYHSGIKCTIASLLQNRITPIT